MSDDVEKEIELINRTNEMLEHLNAKTPHCIICSSELHSSNFDMDGFGNGITLYACQNQSCSERNKYIQRYNLLSPVGNEPIFKPKS